MKKVSTYTLATWPENYRAAKRLGKTTTPVTAWRTLDGGMLRTFDGVTPHPMVDQRIDADQVQALRSSGRDIVISVFDMG